MVAKGLLKIAMSMAVMFLSISLMVACATGKATEPKEPLENIETKNEEIKKSVPGEAPIYWLGSGDLVRISVYKFKDLSGEFRVDGVGTISFPLIGDVDAKGLSVAQLQGKIEEKLKDGYLKKPNVTVEVVNFRPFYIVGEVKKPGSYPYVNGMTVWNAIALAGGLTKRADKDDINIRRERVKGEKEEMKVDLETIVFPGDIIEVTQRYF